MRERLGHHTCTQEAMSSRRKFLVVEVYLLLLTLVAWVQRRQKTERRVQHEVFQEAQAEKETMIEGPKHSKITYFQPAVAWRLKRLWRLSEQAAITWVRG